MVAARIRRAVEIGGHTLLFWATVAQTETLLLGTNYAPSVALALLACAPVAWFWRATEPEPLL